MYHVTFLIDAEMVGVVDGSNDYGLPRSIVDAIVVEVVTQDMAESSLRIPRQSDPRD
jgi:hypothetical protein